jgi:putative NADPH-quinone reductase
MNESAMKQIAIIQGNPDPKGGHFGHALADAYLQAARGAGHAVQTIAVAQLDFPWLRTQQEFNSGGVPPAIGGAQQILSWANHLLIIFPLWHGTMPAVLKAFLEQAFRPGFAMQYRPGKLPNRLLTGKSARIIVTMGMPSLLYRWLFRAHGVKTLERSILWWSGIGPIRTKLIGSIGDLGAHRRQQWLDRVRNWGARGR